MLADESAEPRSLERAGRRLAVRCALGLVLLVGIPAEGQFSFHQFPSTNGERNGQIYPDNSGQNGEPNTPEKKRIKLLNAERQKALISDTEKLLRLVKELNDEVAASESAGMTGEQLHKLDEIGKLAHSVKEKMSYGVGAFPAVNPPLTIQPPIQ